MRTVLALLCLVVVMAVANPSQAQLRETAQNGPVPTQLYGAANAAGDFLGDLFSPEHFRMSHSYEVSATSFGGDAMSMGMYTNTMRWQFNSAWAARMDVSVANSFTGNAFGEDRTRVFLRNAEVAYRPSENMQFRLQVQQSPYGRYASPYGAYGAHYNPYRSAFAPMRTPTGDLFWKN